MRRRTAIVVATAAALAWSGPGTAQPVPNRGPAVVGTTIAAGPVRIVQALTPGWVIYPKLVSDRSGVSTIVWERDSRIKAARSRADGTWGPTVDLGPGHAPDTAVDRRGAVTAAWRTYGGRDLVTRRWVRGSWRAPVTLTGPSSAEFVHVWPYRVATNPAGDTMVAWARGYGADPGAYRTRLEVAYRSHDGGWEHSVELDRRRVSPLAAFVHRDGDATLVYDDHGAPVIRRRGLGGRWGRATATLAGHFGGAAANSRGRLVAAVFDGTALVVHERRPGSGWLAPVEVAPIARQRGVAPMAMDGSGRAAIAFTRNGQRLHVADRSADSPWSSPELVSPVGQRAAEIQLAVGPASILGAAWVDSAAEHPRVWVAGLVPGSGWSEAIALTGPRSRSLYYLDLDFESDGDLIVTWADRLAGQGGRRVVTRTVSLTGG